MAKKSKPVPVHAKLDTSNCETHKNDKLFAVWDEDKTVIFLNPDRHMMCRTLIDGCAVTDGERADWVVSRSQVGHVIVEFKGHDIEKAYSQICSTADLWKAHKISRGEILGALIICNRVPKAAISTSLQRKFAARYKSQLTVKSHKAGISFSLSDLLVAK